MRNQFITPSVNTVQATSLGGVVVSFWRHPDIGVCVLYWIQWSSMSNKVRREGQGAERGISLGRNPRLNISVQLGWRGETINSTIYVSLQSNYTI